jgi:hypothetical protein
MNSNDLAEHNIQDLGLWMEDVWRDDGCLMVASCFMGVADVISSACS